MTLKIKANRNSHQRDNLFESDGDKKSGNEVDFKGEIDSMKMEMVKEIRDMKNGLQDSFTKMTQSIQEMNSNLKQTLNQLKGDKGIEEQSLADISKCPYSGQIISNRLKQKIDEDIKKEDVVVVAEEEEAAKDKPEAAGAKPEEAKAEEEAKPEAAPVVVVEKIPLTSEQIEFLQECTKKFLGSFSIDAEKQPSINQLKVVLNMTKNPNIAENFKTVQLSNEKFRRIKQSNEYFLTFLKDIGFTQTEGGKCPMGSDLKFKFIPLPSD